MRAAIFLGLVVCLALRAEPDPPKPPCVVLISNTGSMKPTFMGGEFVVMNPPKPIAELKTGRQGDIVIWRDQGRALNIVHRAWAKGRAANGEWWLITKGDNNAMPDSKRLVQSEIRGIISNP